MREIIHEPTKRITRFMYTNINGRNIRLKFSRLIHTADGITAHIVCKYTDINNNRRQWYWNDYLLTTNEFRFEFEDRTFIIILTPEDFREVRLGIGYI